MNPMRARSKAHPSRGAAPYV